MAYFSKTSEKITPESYFSKVKSITVRVCITNCSGTIWFTDLQLQEGPALTGYVPHTESRLKEDTKVWFNGVVRSSETVIVCNLGNTSGGFRIKKIRK